MRLQSQYTLELISTRASPWKEAARLNMLSNTEVAAMAVATVDEVEAAAVEAVAEEVEQAVEAAFEAADEAVAEKTLSMTPSAIKKREARARAKAEKEMA